MDMDHSEPPSACDLEQPPSLEESVSRYDEPMDDSQSSEEKSEENIAVENLLASEMPSISGDESEDMSVCRCV